MSNPISYGIRKEAVISITEKRNDAPFRGLTQSWSRNWAIFAGSITLGTASVLGAAALFPSIGAMVAGNATTDQIILFGVTVMTGVGATMTLNTGIRLASLEAAVNDDAETQNKLEKSIKVLERAVERLSPPLPPYELLLDVPSLWARLMGPYIGINPSLRSEISAETVRDGFLRYTVNPVALEIWRERALKGDINIVLAKGRRVEREGVVSFCRNHHDLAHVVRLTVFLDALSRLPGVDTSRIRIIFSEKETSDLKSVFLSDIVNDQGVIRRGAVVYTNSHLLNDPGRRQVAIYYQTEQVGEAESRWRTLSAGAHRWTIPQLRNCFQDHLPSEQNQVVPSVPKDFPFNPTTMWDFQGSVPDIDNGDHFTIARRVASKMAAVVKRKQSS